MIIKYIPWYQKKKEIIKTDEKYHVISIEKREIIKKSDKIDAIEKSFTSQSQNIT